MLVKFLEMKQDEKREEEKNRASVFGLILWCFRLVGIGEFVWWKLKSQSVAAKFEQTSS